MISSFKSKLGIAAVAAATAGTLAISAAPAMADGGVTCTQGSGTLSLSPGLTETAKAQSLVAKGAVTGCGTTNAVAKYVVHMNSSKHVTCASLLAEGGSAEGTGLLKWGRKLGTSVATAVLTGSLSGLSLTGSITAGPYAGSSYATELTGGTPVFEGIGAPCSKTNPLKSVTYTSGILTIG